ncbi:LPXTG cell wall anchor domain-containing protein [Collinsella aerofaciens]|uniref:LPXTG cell wall anchor domain-containing protein n=1 Tax=Collinsella aerofaciens TaxID=74426 RepID=UPI00189C4585|nr:LPXTG cell wall anchor domain-containing protein [Collinsella aerofaciens]MDB1863480.1 LPXTG cell wall anchor domain-containing protein [Collinsella aerofaciens]
MAALFTTPKRNDKTSGAHFVEPDVRRRTLLAHGSWRRVTRRIVVGAVCALTVSSLLMPSISLAAEWVNVGGTQYNTAAGDEAGTWAWDGADDMKLNGYNGGAIQAAGKLNIAYEGKNTVKTEPDYTGAAIKAQDGTSQKAELNITSSNSTDELNVTAEADAIKSTGDLSISGPGTVNTTSTTSDGIEAKGDLSITGSGTVNATGGTEGIQSKGKTTIDSSGTVIAKGSEGYGIAAGSDLIIKGGGKVEASSIEEAAIWANGNIDISGGSQVEASSQGDLAVDAEGSLAVTNASLDASGVEYGVYAYKGVTLDHATVTVRTSASGGQAIALITDGDDIVIKNGSIVDAFAEGKFSVAISTRNHQPNVAGGHIYISDSVVKAIARYVETGGNGPDHYSEDQNDEIIPESEGLNIGIFAQTEKGITPATISIVRSKVTAEGDTAAIFALAMSADGKAIGTIEIKDATIQTPAGGKVIDYRNKEELSDGIVYEAGQTIGTGDATIDSPYDAAVAKSTVIVPPEETKPEEKHGKTKPEGSKSEGTKTTKTVAVAAKGAKTVGKLAATGDTSNAAIVAAALAGTAAIAAGALASRKRS